KNAFEGASNWLKDTFNLSGDNKDGGAWGAISSFSKNALEGASNWLKETFNLSGDNKSEGLLGTIGSFSQSALEGAGNWLKETFSLSGDNKLGGLLASNEGLKENLSLSESKGAILDSAGALLKGEAARQTLQLPDLASSGENSTGRQALNWVTGQNAPPSEAAPAGLPSAPSLGQFKSVDAWAEATQNWAAAQADKSGSAALAPANFASLSAWSQAAENQAASRAKLATPDSPTNVSPPQAPALEVPAGNQPTSSSPALPRPSLAATSPETAAPSWVMAPAQAPSSLALQPRQVQDGGGQIPLAEVRNPVSAPNAAPSSGPAGLAGPSAAGSLAVGPTVKESASGGSPTFLPPSRPSNLNREEGSGSYLASTPRGPEPAPSSAGLDLTAVSAQRSAVVARQSETDWMRAGARAQAEPALDGELRRPEALESPLSLSRLPKNYQRDMQQEAGRMAQAWEESKSGTRREEKEREDRTAPRQQKQSEQETGKKQQAPAQQQRQTPQPQRSQAGGTKKPSTPARPKSAWMEKGARAEGEGRTACDRCGNPLEGEAAICLNCAPKRCELSQALVA
ncbi:hypothetical protein JST97_34740, partial [bacterium]|nr:hypothetical protein [bacterium]